MGFKNNYEQADMGGLKPEGEYECIITAVEEKITKNGKTYLHLTYVIRNDVSGQKYGNACLFHSLWKRKEPTAQDMQVCGYGFGQVMALGKAAGLPDGKEYESLKQFCEDLLERCIRVKISHHEYNGKTSEQVDYVMQTKFPQCRHVFKKTEKTGGQAFAQPVQYADVSTEGFGEFTTDDGVPF